MGHLLREWWPVLLLLWLPGAVQSVVTVWITRAFRRLDESHPDDMPMTAGDWLYTELVRLDLVGRLTTIVTDKDAKASLDAYHPKHNVIQLTAETHFKRDPMHWAIAAHELGHARFKLALPILGRFIIAMAFVKKWIVGAAIGLVFGNVLFALPHVTAYAKLLFEIALALDMLVLLDEAVASTLALRSLRISKDMMAFQLSNARRALRLAFSTYLVAFATRVLLLTQWHLVELHTRTAAVPPTYSLTSLGSLAVLASSLVLLAYTVTLLGLAARKPGTNTRKEGMRVVVGQLALILFVCLLWNHRADARWAQLVIAALYPITAWISIVLSLPGVLLDLIVFDRITKRFRVDPTHRTPELDKDHRAGASRRRAGNEEFSALLKSYQAADVLESRIQPLLQLAFVPLVVAFWMS